MVYAPRLFDLYKSSAPKEHYSHIWRNGPETILGVSKEPPKIITALRSGIPNNAIQV